MAPSAPISFARSIETDTWVLIENQIERTDHTHLGQVLTYAAGLHAATIIWISSQFTDEHRAALDWLNEITDEEFAFFGVEVELWRIGGSSPAPRFNVVSKPNDWTRAVSTSARRVARGEPEGIDINRVAYWSEFGKALDALGGPLKSRQQPPRLGYYSFTIDAKKELLPLCLPARRQTSYWSLCRAVWGGVSALFRTA